MLGRSGWMENARLRMWPDEVDVGLYGYIRYTYIPELYVLCPLPIFDQETEPGGQEIGLYQVHRHKLSHSLARSSRHVVSELINHFVLSLECVFLVEEFVRSSSAAGPSEYPKKYRLLLLGT